MARRSGFFAELARAQREAEKQKLRRQREQEKQVKAFQRAQDQYLRSLAVQKKADERLRMQNAKEAEKERRRLYLESREAEAEYLNAKLEAEIEALQNILHATLSIDDYIDLNKLKEIPNLPTLYVPAELNAAIPKPIWEKYLPVEPTGVNKFLPGAKNRYNAALETAKNAYDRDLAKAEAAEQVRLSQLSTIKTNHARVVAEINSKVSKQHQEIVEFQAQLTRGEPQAVIDYCKLVIESSVYPDNFPQQAKLAYVPDSKQLVIEYDLPTLDAIPENSAVKYVKTKDEITSSPRPQAQRKALYASVIAQITLRTIHEMFEADRYKHIETIVFNGHVDVIDKATGRDIRPCLVTLRVTRDVFTQMDLARVDPELCLKNLSASVSKNPSELAPVRPVVEFNMVDPRFVEEADVLSTLDTRPNLMELSPSEFESLITNLFQKMGLESRMTQASRDGGVDCVAWDPRPIFGGKVIIQAKRYKHTVGVSAVRDLFGTLQNEGASKGILVTTSGYGKAAFEFAQNKPLELLDGSNLLYLLAEHAGMEAKIEVPELWKDPEPDSGE